MQGLYIHIPFCKRRCVYCGFYSTTLLGLRQAYVDAVCREMLLRRGGTLRTIYLGGGTPSQLDAWMLQKVFSTIHKAYDVEPGAEVTMECNPDDVDERLASTMLEVGVNRVSMGVQTFSDERLRFLQRRHTARQAVEAVELLRKSGFCNISIDLMFGFPGETLAEWQADIDRALALEVEHLSAYSLMYEEGTPLHSKLMAGEVEEIADDTYLAMYEMLVERLEKGGYEHYEISNFALPGRRSLHNSSYWDGTPYTGIGAAAHSYDGFCRKANVADVEQYIAALSEGRLPCETERLTLYDSYNDMITTALRTREGISTTEVVQRFGVKLHTYLMGNARKHIDRGLLAIDQGRLHLTLPGIAMSDTVMSDLMFV